MPDRDDRGISRRRAMAGLAAAGVAAALPTVASSAAARDDVAAPELEETTVAEPGRAMEEGRLSSEDLCRQYRERIDALERAMNVRRPPRFLATLTL